MPSVTLTNEQVLELVQQLPAEAQESVLKSLAAKRWPAWAQLGAGGEDRLRRAAQLRGLHWDAMSETQREQFMDDVVHEDRPCRK